MQRNILILVVLYSFSGVVLAQNDTISIQVKSESDLEEHLGSVYIIHSANEIIQTLDFNNQIKLPVKLNDIIVFQSPLFESDFLVKQPNAQDDE